MNSLLRLSQGDRIIDLSYITTEQLPVFFEGQRSLFDIKVKDETSRWYIIEMQRKMEKDYLNRTQLYGCYTYVSQIKKGMKHKDLLPVVIISIIGAQALPDELPYISYHHIKESNIHK
ncbi:PD-(D/E)XK nuclease family transposase [Rickettsia sibirica]|uniref:PD-(D/E)XK nuclease family transposase n=1 Tax=Rickettsia sibirica TaxID=35793 RepID=UPI00031999F6|nr:PD-(D/E)XK nuclease family transposase [Rickettsia sibirica]